MSAKEDRIGGGHFCNAWLLGYIIGICKNKHQARFPYALCHKGDFNPCWIVNVVLLLNLSYVTIMCTIRQEPKNFNAFFSRVFSLVAENLLIQTNSHISICMPSMHIDLPMTGSQML